MMMMIGFRDGLAPQVGLVPYYQVHVVWHARLCNSISSVLIQQR